MLKKIVISLVFILTSFLTQAQTWTYVFVDPCTGVAQNIYVPFNGEVAVTYYSEVNTFTQNEFTDGTFEGWLGEVYDRNSNLAPCQDVAFATTNMMGQNMVMNILSLLDNLSTAGDMKQPDQKEDNPKNSNQTSPNGGNNNTITQNQSLSNNQTNGAQNNNGQQGNNPNQPNNQQGGSNGEQQGNNPDQQGGNTGEQQGQGGEQQGNNQPNSPQQGNSQTGQSNKTTNQSGSNGEQTTDPKTDDKKDDGATVDLMNGNKSSNSGGSNGEGGSKKPTVVGNGDIIAYKINPEGRAIKINGGYTSVNYDGTKSNGIMFDYTTFINAANGTYFYSWIKPKSVLLVANTFTYGFNGNGYYYNTVCIGYVRKFRSFKAVGVIAGALGNVYDESFSAGIAAAGGMKDGAITPRLNYRAMGIVVYAPYVKYYKDLVLKSPVVVVPNAGFTYKFTKTFQSTLTVGCAYSVQANVLNFTAVVGAKLAL